MDKKLVCPCGLTCCDCMFYKSEIYETARKLQALIKEHRLDKFLAACSSTKSYTAMGEHLGLSEDQTRETLGRHLGAFAKMPQFMEVLDSLVKLQCKATCQEAGGCSIAGNRHECQALKCIKARGYEGCWQCGEFSSCDKLKFLRAGYGFVIEENLRTVKEKGFAAVQSRGDKYYEWQRR